MYSKAFSSLSSCSRRFQRGFRGLHGLSGQFLEEFRGVSKAFQVVSTRLSTFYDVPGRFRRFRRNLRVSSMGILEVFEKVSDPF